MATVNAGVRLTADRISTYAGEPEIRETNSSTFTTVALQTDDIVVPVVAGRRYKVVWDGEFQSSAGALGELVRVSLREDTSSGTVIQLRQAGLMVTAQAYPVLLQAFYTAVSTGNKTFVVTAVRQAGAGTYTAIANAQSPTLFYVENA